nr:hypothetical protein HK105_001072 [Polyrhizophydium stewartii]
MSTLLHDLEEQRISGPAERTAYAKSRPVRAVTKNSLSNFDPIAVLAHSDGHVMIPCERYTGKPGSGEAGSQPFRISVHRRVLAVMDIHAHLMATEVIGFLAGKWDPKSNRLEITSALPCRSVEQELHGAGEDRHYNVELDPASEVETRELVEKLNLRIVGWYHSHPTFAPDPSLIDLVNQRNYQGLFRQSSADPSSSAGEPQSRVAPNLDAGGGPDGTTAEPFVGAIVGPYDPNLPKSISAINWFYVGNSDEDKNRPKQLMYAIIDSEPRGTLDEAETKALLKLIGECGQRGDRVDFNSGWRNDRWETKREKLQSSLLFQLVGQPGARGGAKVSDYAMASPMSPPSGLAETASMQALPAVGSAGDGSSSSPVVREARKFVDRIVSAIDAWDKGGISGRQAGAIPSGVEE